MVGTKASPRNAELCSGSQTDVEHKVLKRKAVGVCRMTVISPGKPL